MVLGESFIKARSWFVDNERDLRDIFKTRNELYKCARYRTALRLAEQFGSLLWIILHLAEL